MPSTTGTRSLNIALLSVRVDDETARMAFDAAEERNWAISEASFSNYISSKRRPHFSDRIRSGDGCVALIDFDEDPQQAAEAATYLQQVFAGRAAVIAMARQNQPQLMLQAMRSGCTEFLTKPIKPELLLEAMRRADQQLAGRNAVTSTTGSVLAIMGAKGGVGTTTLAVHLASFLSHDCGKKVLLIDNQAQFGHVCIYLGLDGSACHFQEIVRNVNRLDSELLRGFVALHSAGLDVLSSPDVGQIARALHPEDVAATLEFLRSEYDFVLVDCAGRFDDVTRAVISTSSQVYVVATPEISAVRDLSRYVDDLTQFDDSSKVKVVINRYSSQFAVSIEEIEKAIRLPVSFSVPNSYIELVRSANLGVPLNSHVNSGFTNEVMRWAKSLVGAADGELSGDSVNAKSKARRLLRNTFAALSGAGMRPAEKRA